MLGDDDYSPEALISAYDDNDSLISDTNALCNESDNHSYENFSKDKKEKTTKP